MEYGIHSVFFFFFPSNHVVSTVSSRKGPGRGKRDVVKRRRSPFLCVEISGKEGKKREEREKREEEETESERFGVSNLKNAEEKENAREVGGRVF